MKVFLYALVGEICILGIGAIVTQYFHIFTRLSIVAVQSIFVIAFVTWLIRRREMLKIKLKLHHINWFVLAAFAIVSFELVTVHYSYTGIVATSHGYEQVTQKSYLYPYFSDEWSGIALAESAIRANSIPLVNPLTENESLAHPLIAFYSFVAAMALMFGVQPLVIYVPLTCIIAILTCIVAWMIGKKSGLSSIGCAAIVLGLPLITNSGNLPGLWTLLPVNLGLLLFLITLYGTISKDLRLFSISGFAALLMYPPLVIFIIPLAIVMIFHRGTNLRTWKTARLLIIGATIVSGAGALVVIVLSQSSSIGSVLHMALSFSVRQSSDGGIVSFMPWDVIPWYVLIASAVGIIILVKKAQYELLTMLTIGIMGWIIYEFWDGVFIIDYSRIVFVSAVLMTIAAGFGVDYACRSIEGSRLSPLLKIAIVIVFLIVAYSYPSQPWGMFVLNKVTPHGVEQLVPESPITEYLLPDDVRLFAGIEGKRFIAPPWKGLVIGAVTHNFPLESKTSTISSSEYSYADFVSRDCAGKRAASLEHEIQYAYVPVMDCPDFELIGSSTEELYLYRTKMQSL